MAEMDNATVYDADEVTLMRETPTLTLIREYDGQQDYQSFAQEVITIGRPSSMHGRPDLDLTPDYRTHRQHARLLYYEDAWWGLHDYPGKWIHAQKRHPNHIPAKR